MKYIITIALIIITCLSVLAQKTHNILILPGQGIVFDKDSLLLYKTTYKEVCKILKIRDKTKRNEVTISHWDGFDPETGESASGSEYIKEINYKSINFEFADEKDNDSVKLRWIRINGDKSLKITTDSGIEMGMINPQIDSIYPETGESYHISKDKLTYNLYPYGISFHLEKLENNDLKVIEISTHFKLNKNGL
jgi:hypothetical protein